jgi:ABC-type uncharacterized transport system substrate-binding protein
MFHNSFMVEQGGLACFSATDKQLGHQAARLVDKILKGAKPADLPIGQGSRDCDSAVSPAAGGSAHRITWQGKVRCARMH